MNELAILLRRSYRHWQAPAPFATLALVDSARERSGKRFAVYFRKACDREFRHIVQQWARLTLDGSPWAATCYHAVRPHCKTDNDAVRCLANRWLEVLWRLWIDRKPYN